MLFHVETFGNIEVDSVLLFISLLELLRDRHPLFGTIQQPRLNLKLYHVFFQLRLMSRL